MTNEFCDLLFEKLNPEERVFKFKSAEVRGNYLTVELLVDSVKYDELLDDRLKKKVTKIASELVPDDVKVKVLFVKTSSDEKTLRSKIIEFMYEQHKTVYGVFNSADYKFDNNGYYCEVTITLEKFVYDYAKGIGLDKQIAEYLDTVAMEEFTVVFSEIPNSSTMVIEDVLPVFDTVDIHLIDAKPIEYYYRGGGIAGYPRYISDITSREKDVDGVCLCGVISEVKGRLIKSKKPRPNAKNEFILYSFLLNDTTGRVKVKFFEKTVKNVDWEQVFVDGAQLIFSGDYKYDNYENKYIYMASTIASAQINFDSINTKIDFNRDFGRYRCIMPEPYEDIAQDDMFDIGFSDDNGIFKNTRFTVFDLETTGLSTETDEIVEIAGIKIIDGKFTEQFSTFVRPSIEIPQEVSEKTNITQKMVENAPLPKDVIPDFYRFCKDTVLVGHNISNFDIPLLNTQAKKYKYEFNNEFIDTLVMARANLHGMSKYNLGAVCAKLNVPLINAHRAINDVAANAKAFIKLMKLSTK